MKVVVNLPTDEYSINKLSEKISTFRATLLLETIKSLNYEETIKKEILNRTLHTIKNEKALI